MPLRDHFRPPLSKQSSWEGLHAMWPAAVVQQLRRQLPPGYVAEPRVRLGVVMEVDVGTVEDHSRAVGGSHTVDNGGAATAVWTAAPAVAVDTDPPDEYEYEVRIYDVERDRRLVAAIEFVSPANKDRAESRESFVNKCAALLRKGVAVSIVDLVTARRFNVYAQLMQLIQHPDPTMSLHDPAIYAASCRWPTIGNRARLEAWSSVLSIGSPLPTLPLWLSPDLAVALELEQSTSRHVTICGSIDSSRTSTFYLWKNQRAFAFESLGTPGFPHC